MDGHGEWSKPVDGEWMRMEPPTPAMNQGMRLTLSITPEAEASAREAAERVGIPQDLVTAAIRPGGAEMALAPMTDEELSRLVVDLARACRQLEGGAHAK